MRTTVTLDPDTEVIVRELMRSRGVGFKVALNEAIRGGTSSRVDVSFTSPSFALGRPTDDPLKALQLAAHLEDNEILAKMRRDA